MAALLTLIIDCGSNALKLTLQCELNHNKNLWAHERPHSERNCMPHLVILFSWFIIAQHKKHLPHIVVEKKPSYIIYYQLNYEFT